MQHEDAGVLDTELIAVFHAQRSKIARFIALRCGSDDVDDLVHELFLKLQTISKPIQKPIPYLFRMADRLVLDWRRGASRQKSRDSDWGHVHDRLSTAAEPAVAETRLIARQRYDAVNTALDKAGARAVTAFKLHRLEGVEQRQIASQLGVSTSTVEKDLRKVYDILLSLREASDEV